LTQDALDTRPRRHLPIALQSVTFSQLSEANLTSLFAKLPSRCVILLEDVDAVSSNRDAETEDSRQIVARERKPASGKVSLSALLNVIDGVGSQEGRILIMTTNHIKRLDEALIRPGRVDKKVELGLADKEMTADIFRLIFKPVKGDIVLAKDAQSDVLTGQDGKVPKATWSQGEEEAEVKRLANEFAAIVPELKFSPAGISSFLVAHKNSPREAIDDVKQLISKPSRISEDAKPEIAEASKLVYLKRSVN
jgi:chaperone BCS1